MILSKLIKDALAEKVSSGVIFNTVISQPAQFWFSFNPEKILDVFKVICLE